eukprot:scaffold5782_cov618-Prasinococcus_capsulatus_cf.AAC.1
MINANERKKREILRQEEEEKEQKKNLFFPSASTATFSSPFTPFAHTLSYPSKMNEFSVFTKQKLQGDLDIALALARFSWAQKYGEFLSKDQCLEKIFEAVTPLVGLQKIRRGRSSQVTPVPLSQSSRVQLAWKWILQSSKLPSTSSSLPEKESSFGKGKKGKKLTKQSTGPRVSSSPEKKDEKDILVKFGSLRTKTHIKSLGKEFFHILEGTSAACQEKEKWYKRIQKSRIHANPRWWRG